jgi:hypothetical protein
MPLLDHRLGEVDAVDRADHSDDRHLRAVRTAALNLLAERARAGEIRFRRY